MARIWVDDIDGGDAEHTRTFSVDGIAYEIDLSTLNNKKFGEALALYIEHGRVVEPPRIMEPSPELAPSSGFTAPVTAPPPVPAPARARPSIPPPARIGSAPASPGAVKTARPVPSPPPRPAPPAAFTEPPQPPPQPPPAPATPADEAKPGGMAAPAGEPAFDLDPVPSATKAGHGKEDAKQQIPVTVLTTELSREDRQKIRRWFDRSADKKLRGKLNERGRLPQWAIDAYFKANPPVVSVNFD